MMKYRIAAIICILLSLLCIAYVVIEPGESIKKSEIARDAAEPEGYDGSDEGALGEVISKPLAEAESGTAEEYLSPIDFEELNEKNPDIYAWIEITGTEISFPLLQRENNGGYYLNHSSLGVYSKSGAIFTESEYNSKTMDDAATVVYGHRMNSGSMFGSMEKLYSESDAIQNYGEIVIYMPERELHYEVFCTSRFDNRHILKNYDFDESDEYEKFISDILSKKELGMHVKDGYNTDTEEKLLILSTCVKGSGNKRFLVLARLAGQ